MHASERSQVALVVFDIAGTTVVDDEAVEDGFVLAFRSSGMEISTEEVKAVMGMPKSVAIARLIEARGRRVEAALVKRIHEQFQGAMLEYYALPGTVRAYAGVSATFERLHAAGVKVALDTGFTSTLADAILRRLEWLVDGHVDLRVASDEVPRGRPYPDTIFEAMRRAGIDDVSTVAKVGDTPADLGAGANAGCGWNVGVTYGTHRRAELERCPHTALIDDIRDLPAVLGLGPSTSTSVTSGSSAGALR